MITDKRDCIVIVRINFIELPHQIKVEAADDFLFTSFLQFFFALLQTLNVFTR